MVIIAVGLTFAFFVGLHLVLRWQHQRRAEQLAAGTSGAWSRAVFPATLGVLMQDGGEPIGKSDRPEKAKEEKKD